MCKIVKLSYVLTLCSFSAAPCLAQTPTQQQANAPTPPATKLEAFSAKTGVVIIRGFSTVGSISRLGIVTIEVREFRDASNPKLRATGLSIQVKEAGRLERDNTSF